MANFYKKSSQLGRSMIEMLGVLAIIGVLSIASIAGYSRAMLRYRLNKQYEQLHTVMIAVEKIGSNFLSLPQSTTLTPYFIQLNEVPSEMVVNGSNDLKDVFGLRWNIYYVYDANTGGKSLNISSFGDQIFPKSQNSLDICHNIMSLAQAHSDTILAVSTSSNRSSTDRVGLYIYGDRQCSGSRKCLRTMTLDDIRELCNKHTSSDAEFKIVW